MSLRIAARWDEVWSLLPGAMESSDPEAVHAARVASRQLRAVLDSASGSFPKPWYRSLLKSAKTITRTLGRVRENDVLLEKLSAEMDTSGEAGRPGIEHLKERVETERAIARAEMLGVLTPSRVKRMRKESQTRFPLSPGKRKGKRARRKAARLLADGTALPTSVRTQIANRINALLAHDASIPDADAVEAHHDARIAVKRIRYLLELFEPAIGDDAAQLIQETKQLQEMLGRLHDLDVSIQLVAHERDDLRDHDSVPDLQLADSLDDVLRHDLQMRRETHTEVAAHWTALLKDGFRERLVGVAAK